MGLEGLDSCLEMHFFFWFCSSFLDHFLSTWSVPGRVRELFRHDLLAHSL